MSKKKIVVLTIIGIIAILEISNVIYHSVYSIYYPEEYAKDMKELEQDRSDNLMRENEENGMYLRYAQEIIPSKLSNDVYHNNAQRVLTEYILTYQGKDKSGDNMVDALNRFYGCPKDTPFLVEISNWNNEMITLELTDDFSCDGYVSFFFGYKPQSDDLRYIIDQTWEEQVKSVMYFLDINP